jgi:hypothetical protein
VENSTFSNENIFGRSTSALNQAIEKMGMILVNKVL